MFCVRCGREGPTIKGLCTDCFLDGRRLLSLPHHVDLERCTSCEEFRVGGRWLPLSVHEAVEEAALGEAAVIPEARVREAGVRAVPNDPRNYEAQVELTLDVDGHEEVARESTVVRLKNTVCQRCSRQLGNYYESILQVRGPGKGLEPLHRAEILESVLSKVEAQSRESRGAFISKVEEMHGGLDFYLSSISLGKGLARDLVNEHGAEMKESSTLVGRKEDGSDMYRVTYLVRMPYYKQGDVVLREGRPLQVLGASKDAVRLLDLRDFRHLSVKPADMRGMRLAVPREELREAVLVSASEGEAQVLHPVSMRTVELRLPPGYRPGETLRVAEVEGELLLAP